MAKKEPMNAVCVVQEFYALQTIEALPWKVEKFKKSHERWLHEFRTYKQLIEQKFAKALEDYTALVVYGELRHAENRAEFYHPDISQGGPRSSSYEEATLYDTLSIAVTGHIHFTEQRWRASFGGEKWGQIAHALVCRLRPSHHFDNNVVFIDHCVDLSHNSSHYMDKSDSKIFTISDGHKYRLVLDAKRDARCPKELLRSPFLKHTKTLRNLLLKGRNVGILQIDDKIIYNVSCSVDDVIGRLINYEPLEWSDTMLDPDHRVGKGNPHSSFTQDTDTSIFDDHSGVYYGQCGHCNSTNPASDWNTHTKEQIGSTGSIEPLSPHTTPGHWFYCPSCDEQVDFSKINITYDEEEYDDDKEEYSKADTTSYPSYQAEFNYWKFQTKRRKEEDQDTTNQDDSEGGDDHKTYKALGW